MTIGTTEAHPAAPGPVGESTGSARGALEVHLVAHTHWDREWYRPATQFQQRLAHLIDHVLDRGRPAPFLLDGQAVVIDDYLAIRPERASELSTRLREGALEAGPWYVLADELIPSGEALVRNLLTGRRILRSLRAIPPSVLYCPDSFGHPAALPAIASGFGCNVIVLWRGYGGERWPSGDTARWRAPDGSTVLLYHLPPDGYETGSHLPTDPERSAQRWRELRALLGARSATGLVLLTAGADHHAPSPEWDDQVAALAAGMREDELVPSSLERFRDALSRRAAGRSLPEVTGELRDSYGYTWTLQGTLGVRAALKRRNAQAERLVSRDTEPWVALADRRDRESSRALLDLAWRSLLLCHPHDTLCGCAIDAVATAMASRLDDATHAAAALRDDALSRMLGHDADEARARAAEWRPAVVVRNATARPRAGVAEVDADLVLAEVAVGPGSAGIPVTPRRPRALSLGSPPLLLQEVRRSRELVREESPHHYPRTRMVERRRLLAWADEVPGYSLRVFPVIEGGRRSAAPPSSPARASADSIECGPIRVQVTGEGLTLEMDGRVIERWLSFEAEGERGDLYTHSAVPDSQVLARFRRARVTAKGPLRAELTAEWELRMPARTMRTETDEGYRVPAATIPLRAVVQLDAGAPFVRVRVSGDQRSSDLRLRVRFRTDTPDPQVFADAAFGPVERKPIDVPAGVTMEQPVPTAPLHRYVSAFDATRGATLYGDGLTEYEVAPDGSIAVTLTRSVGELSRHDLPERPGHAGYPAATPLAQARGPFEAGFAMLLHGPRSDASIDTIERTADDVLLPLQGHPWRSAITPPDGVPGVELVGAGLACSAIKPGEDAASIVLRCVNLLDHAVAGEWRLSAVTEAWLARLDETPLGALRVEQGRIAFEAPPRGIVTILAR